MRVAVLSGGGPAPARRPGLRGQGRLPLAGCLRLIPVLLATSLASSPAAGAAPRLARVASLGALGPLGARSMPTRARQQGISQHPSATRPHWACAAESCDAIIDPHPVRAGRRWKLPGAEALLEGSGELGGFDPQDLQAAYEIPVSTGVGQTIAVVDAYGYPGAEADLASYRARYGLPACTVADGCFSKVNEAGEEADYPPASSEGWEDESALDLDMASAACPECHVMLVEASSASVEDLGAAVDTAARLGASEISNSYGLPEEECGPAVCEEFDSDYEHPGILVTAAAGDSGYDNFELGASSPSFPASAPDVVAVGGTRLTHSYRGQRGWSEEAWFLYFEGGSGGGCSISRPKPSWQKETGCATRMDNDVAAVASCRSPVSVYVGEGWNDACGTSVSAPLVAGIAAHASAYARSLPGADAFYQDPGATFDITEGTNGECILPPAQERLCYAGPGYDGPTGEGSPLGPLAPAPAVPSVATTAADGVGPEAGTLNGRLDPQGLTTTYRFEYGETTSYGASAPTPAGTAGAGTEDQVVSATITTLRPETVYHYRVVAANAAGTSYGEDETFITASPSVSAVQPTSGPLGGEEPVQVSGTALEGAISVDFGATPAASFRVDSPSTITATPQAGSGTVDVTVTTPAGTSDATSSDRFTFALGPVLGWGNNEHEDLLGNVTLARGPEPPELSDVPVEVSSLAQASSLAAGGSHGLALLEDGTVMSWGAGISGELGDGTRVGSARAVTVCAPEIARCLGGPYLEGVRAIAAGEGFSLALLSSGVVVAWGGGDYGDLGIGDQIGSQTPAPVCMRRESPCEPSNYLSEVVAIAAGKLHALALLRNGTVMAWGDDEEGQLAVGAGVKRCAPSHYKCIWNPRPVPGLSEVTAIAAGNEFSLALERDGSVKAWGAGAAGQLGDGTHKKSKTPVTVCEQLQRKSCLSPLTGVRAITAGERTSYALLSGGTVAAWGSNLEGALGEGSFTGPQTCSSEGPCAQTPVAVSHLSGVRALASGVWSEQALATLEDGGVVAWGANYLGQLGDGSTSSSDEPVAVCAAYATGPCPHGPYLEGPLTAIAVGGKRDFVSVAP